VVSLDAYLQREAGFRVKVKVKLTQLVRRCNGNRSRLTLKHYGKASQLTRRLGSVQNLTHHRDALRINLRFERKISYQVLGFV